MSRSAIYSAPALAELPRILSFLDRRPISKTSGCADRVHWQWKFTDFPGARFQEAAWTLASAWSFDSPENPYFKQPRILEWTESIMNYWTRIQRADGSFDEAYPFERSFVATGFSSLAISEGLRLIEKKPKNIVESLARAGDFLIRTDETHAFISNHRSGAAAALLRIARLTGDDRYRARARDIIASVIERQSSEGWYLEYTGADPGYETQGTFYLALCQQADPDRELLDSLRRACVFLEHFVYPDGALGVEIGSRNTEFIFPGGFEILAPEIPEAAAIAERFSRGIAERKTPGPWSMDSYNILPITNSFFVAAAAAETPRTPRSSSGEQFFQETGLFVHRNDRFHLVVSTKKGGALRVTATEEPGYAAELNDGTIASSQSESEFHMEPGKIDIRANFCVSSTTVMNPWLFLGFRLFSLTIGRIPSVARFLKARLVANLTRPGKIIPMTLHRVITFEQDVIRIEDEVTTKVAVKRLARGGPICSIHMGSSQYFEPRSLNDTAESREIKIGEIARFVRIIPADRA